MNIYMPTYVSGPIILIIMFALCLFSVVGVKTVYVKIVKKFKPKQVEKKPKQIKTTKPVKQRKPIRSIEINPDDVDRIYVRKSS